MSPQEIQALKEKLVRRLNKSFQNQMINYSFGFEEGVSTFLDFIKLPINSEESALDLTVLPNLYQYYVGATSYEEQLTIVKEIATSLDPVLKKILYYVDNAKYNQLITQKKGLKDFILALPLIIKDYPNNKPELILYDIVNIQITDRGMPYDLNKAYFTRNHVHAAKEWDDTELSANIKACLVTYLYAFFEHYQQLKLVISPEVPSYDFTTYLQRTLTEFQKNLLSDYTDLSAKETDLYDENLTPMAKEYYEADYEEDEDFDDKDFDDEDFELVEETNRITKPTKVNEIRIQVPQMLVRGDAGMGKTTTLEHLFLADLQNALQNLAIIPFFFELKDYNGKDLLAQIARQNKVDEIALRKALQEGKVCLFLDGFDEILSDEKRNHLEIIIKDEILTTPSQVLISSRVREYEHDIFKMRVFDLQALNKDQIREFASKNIADDKKAIFLQALFEKENSILLSICRNIFILKVYKNEIIETENGEISSKNIGKLLQNLVNRRVDRQIKENKPNANTVKKDLGKYKKMINFLAYTLIDKELSFEYDLVVELLKNEFGDLRLADECLNFYKSIGLIKGEIEILKFTHKLYWEYFAAEFIWAKIQLQFDDIQRYVAIPKWKKVLNLVRGLAGETSTKIVETVAVADALTMAESIGSSIEQKPEEVIFVAIEAEKQARNFENVEVSAQGFLALMELEQYQIIAEVFKNVYKYFEELVDKKGKVKRKNRGGRASVNILNMIKYNKSDNFLIDFVEIIKNDISDKNLKQVIGIIDVSAITSLDNFYLILLEREAYNSIITLIRRGYIINDNYGISLWHNTKSNRLKWDLLLRCFIKLDKISLIGFINKQIEKQIKSNEVFLSLQVIKKYSLESEFNIISIIDNLILKADFSSIKMVKNIVLEYDLLEKYPMGFLIDEMLLTGESRSLKKAKEWAKEFELEQDFLILSESENQEKKIDLQYEKHIKNILNLFAGEFKIGLTYSKSNFNRSIYKAVRLRPTQVFKTKSYFLDTLISTQCVRQLDLNSYKILRYPTLSDFGIADSITSNITIGYVIECNVINIIPSRVFVKIKGEKHKASISIKELSIKYITDITLFEYNYEKLHIGQKLTAKVIAIDEKNGIQLSLRQELETKIQLPKLSLKQVVNCLIKDISIFGIAVNVLETNEKGHIFISEISDKKIHNIFDFEYNGEKLYKGKKLTAKVIAIDEKNGIQLSLKQVN